VRATVSNEEPIQYVSGTSRGLLTLCIHNLLRRDVAFCTFNGTRYVYTVSVGSHSTVRHRVNSLQPQATTDEAVRHCCTAACLLYPHGQHIPCVLFSSVLGFLLSSGCFWCLDLLVKTTRITNNDASCTFLFYHEQQQQQ
jgi:hypothetical protein